MGISAKYAAVIRFNFRRGQELSKDRKEAFLVKAGYTAGVWTPPEAITPIKPIKHGKKTAIKYTTKDTVIIRSVEGDVLYWQKEGFFVPYEEWTQEIHTSVDYDNARAYTTQHNLPGTVRFTEIGLERQKFIGMRKW